jgi:hypothetical protein
MKSTKSILVLLGALVVGAAACDKNAVQQIAGPQAGGASVKFFNFAVGSPGVNFFINDRKTTAIGNTACFSRDTLVNPNISTCATTGIEATTGTAYGGAGNGASGWYSDVVPGPISITSRIAVPTDKNLIIATLPVTVDENKFYSYYLSGIYNTTTKTADSFVVEDVLPAADFTVAYVRFVNASSTTQPMTLYARNRTTLEEVAVGGATAYQSAGAFTPLTPGSYDLSTRNVGSSTNVFTRTPVSFAAGRVYTIGARGNTATASTMLLDNTANR